MLEWLSAFLLGFNEVKQAKETKEAMEDKGAFERHLEGLMHGPIRLKALARP